MPYVPPVPERERLNPEIDTLAEMIIAESKADETDYSGHLRYCAFGLVLRVLALLFGKSYAYTSRNTKRAKFNLAINALAEAIADESKSDKTSFAGNLNYSLTRLMLKVLVGLFGLKIRYWMTALTHGAFTDAADHFRERYGYNDSWECTMTKGVFRGVMHEFDRRYCDKYEDLAIKKNGDVDLYAQLEAGLKELDAGLPGKE